MTQELNDKMVKRIEELENQIVELNDVIEKLKNKSGRKSEVLDLLNTYESISILEISKKIGISTKNVSSQLTYLRSDGYKIFTDNNGRKVLMK